MKLNCNVLRKKHNFDQNVERDTGGGEESAQLGGGLDWVGGGTFMGSQYKPEVGPLYKDTLHTVGPVPRDIIKYSQFFRRTKTNIKSCFSGDNICWTL